MRALALLASALVSVVACGAQVVVPSASGDATSGSGGAPASAGSGGAPCPGKPFECADACGSHNFVAVTECVGGAWVCPPDTYDLSKCKSGCWGPIDGCEICGTEGPICKPHPACLAKCPTNACLECPAVIPSTPHCACDCASGSLTCHWTGCCSTGDAECGDPEYVRCVNGVCKPAESGVCWSDLECPGSVCIGGFVCPCGATCDTPDQTGYCKPAQP